MDLTGSKELIRLGWRDVNDADRCAAIGISPATGTLHRRLRDVLNNSNALIAEIERLSIRIDTPKEGT